MFFREIQQKTIRKDLIKLAEDQIGREFSYDVEFYESEENTATKLIAYKKDKEFLNVQNIMTDKGFKDLQALKGWTGWETDLIAVLKKKINDKKAEKKPIWKKFLNLFR